MKAAARRLPLAVKMVLLTLALTLVTWAITDGWQTIELRRLFVAELQQDLEQRGRIDRDRFDIHIQGMRHAARILAIDVGMQTYLAGPEWLASQQSPRLIEHIRPPRWMAAPSILRAFFHARRAWLLDPEGRVREVYHNLPPSPGTELPSGLLQPSNLLRKLTHSQSYLTNIDDFPHVIVTWDITDAQDRIKATLMLDSPLDSLFLSEAAGLFDKGQVMALVKPGVRRVVASSAPSLIPDGASIGELQDHFLMIGKSFFDYGASDLELEFISFMPVEKAEHLTTSVLSTVAGQRAILGSILAAAFALLLGLLGYRLRGLAGEMTKMTRRLIGHTRGITPRGDELAQLNDAFQALGRAVIEYRRRLETENAERLELHRQALEGERHAEEARRLMALTETLGLGIVIHRDGEWAAFNPLMERIAARFGGAGIFTLDSNERQRVIELHDAAGICRAFRVEHHDLLGSDSCVVRDITDQREAEERLRVAAAVSDHVLDAVLITDADGLIIQVNPAFTEITGYTKTEAAGRTPEMIRSDRHDEEFYRRVWHTIISTSQWRGEMWVRRKDGEVFPAGISVSALRDAEGRIGKLVTLIADITEHKAHEQRLSALAFRDPLTGLPNRTLLHDRLGQAILEADRDHIDLAVLYMDLDGFKEVNDTLGHDRGDLLLQQTADRLTGSLRGSDTAARLGGDEFVLVLRDVKELKNVARIADKVCCRLAAPYHLGDHEARVTVSLGIAIFPQDGHQVEELLKKADAAMYQAKKAGKNRFCYASPPNVLPFSRPV